MPTEMVRACFLRFIIGIFSRALAAFIVMATVNINRLGVYILLIVFIQFDIRIAFYAFSLHRFAG